MGLEFLTMHRKAATMAGQEDQSSSGDQNSASRRQVMFRLVMFAILFVLYLCLGSVVFGAIEDAAEKQSAAQLAGYVRNFVRNNKACLDSKFSNVLVLIRILKSEIYEYYYCSSTGCWIIKENAWKSDEHKISFWNIKGRNCMNWFKKSWTLRIKGYELIKIWVVWLATGVSDNRSFLPALYLPLLVSRLKVFLQNLIYNQFDL